MEWISSFGGYQFKSLSLCVFFTAVFITAADISSPQPILAEVHASSAVQVSKEVLEDYTSNHLQADRKYVAALDHHVDACMRELTAKNIEASFDALVKVAPRGRHIKEDGNGKTGMYILEQFENLGFAVQTEEIYVDGSVSLNIIGTEPGGPNLSDCFVEIGAHYDNLPEGGIGADDNLTAVAAMLAGLRAVKNEPRAQLPRCRIRAIAFTAEEFQGSPGSAQHVKNLVDGTGENSLDRFQGVVVMDQISYVHPQQDSHDHLFIAETFGKTRNPRKMMDITAQATEVMNSASGTKMTLVANYDAFASDHVSYLKESTDVYYEVDAAKRLSNTEPIQRPLPQRAFLPHITAYEQGADRIGRHRIRNSADSQADSSRGISRHLMASSFVQEKPLRRRPQQHLAQPGLAARDGVIKEKTLLKSILIIGRDDRVTEKLFNHRLTDTKDKVNFRYAESISRIAFMNLFLLAYDGAHEFATQKALQTRYTEGAKKALRHVSHSNRVIAIP